MIIFLYYITFFRSWPIANNFKTLNIINVRVSSPPWPSLQKYVVQLIVDVDIEWILFYLSAQHTSTGCFNQMDNDNFVKSCNFDWFCLICFFFSSWRAELDGCVQAHIWKRILSSYSKVFTKVDWSDAYKHIPVYWRIVLSILFKIAYKAWLDWCIQTHKYEIWGLITKRYHSQKVDSYSNCVVSI